MMRWWSLSCRVRLQGVTANPASCEHFFELLRDCICNFATDNRTGTCLPSRLIINTVAQKGGTRILLLGVNIGHIILCIACCSSCNCSAVVLPSSVIERMPSELRLSLPFAVGTIDPWSLAHHAQEFQWLPCRPVRLKCACPSVSYSLKAAHISLSLTHTHIQDVTKTKKNIITHLAHNAIVVPAQQLDSVIECHFKPHALLPNWV